MKTAITIMKHAIIYGTDEFCNKMAERKVESKEDKLPKIEI